MRISLLATALVAALVIAAVVSACGSPQPTAAPTTAAPTAAAPAAASETPSQPPAQAGGSATEGADLWPTLRCVRCHGPSAEGVSGPKLAGTDLSAGAVLETVRSGRGSMPAYTPAQVSDQALLDLHAWFQSLGP